MVESSDCEFAPFVESVFVSFDKVSVKDAIYVREYDPIYEKACMDRHLNARMDRYFTTKKSFFKYIKKVFNSNEDISATIAVKFNNGELMNLNSAPTIQNDFIKHGYSIGEKDDGGFFKLRKLTVVESLLNDI